MKFNEFINRFIGLGLWGVIVVVSLVLLAMAATLLVARRDREINNGRISWGKIWFSFISTVLFLISGTWSGWAKYNIYAGFNEAQAWVVSIGFVLCGGVTAIALQYFASNAINESRSARGSQVFFLVFFSLFWLAISPFLNARFLCENETIKQEVGLRFAELDSISKPLIEEYSFYRNKLVPQLVEIHKYLEDMVQEQSKPELGGCGMICRQFTKSADMLWPSVNRLYRTYDPDDPEQDLRAAVEELRNSIVSLLAGIDWSAEEIRMRFYQSASRWAEFLFKARNADPPGLALKQAMASLDSLLVFLHDYQMTHATTAVENRAVTAALSTLEPLINDLRISFQEHEQGNVFKPLSHLQTASGQSAAFNLASISSIRMGTKLMRKHFKSIWPDALLAFFIDLAAMSFIYAPMIVAFLRGRPVQLAIERVRRKKLKVRLVKAKLDTLLRPARVLDKEKNALLKNHEKILKVLAAGRTKDLEAVELEFNKRAEDINSKRQALVAEMNVRLETVNEDLETAIQQATSSAEEHLIQGKHELYRENIKAQYAGKLEELARLEQLLQDDLAAGPGKVNDSFDRREEREKESFIRADRTLEKRAGHLEQMHAGYTKALAEAEQELEEARDKLTAVRDTGCSYT